MSKELKKLIGTMSEKRAKKALYDLVSACLTEFDFEEEVSAVLDKYKLRPPEEEFTDDDDD